MKYAFIGGIPTAGKSFLAKKYGYKCFSNPIEAEKEILKLMGYN